MYDISAWTEKDLIQLIDNSIQENIQLDYKSSKALENTEKKKTEISKDVSALANSAGGVLIYGIEEKDHIPKNIDNGFDPTIITKEWLEQIVNSRIQRKIDGVIIRPIELESTNPGRVVYVVSVPQSIRAPHQAHDKRFYKRYNFESVPMEEYEIRDVSHRSNGPLLKLFFSVDDVTTIEEQVGENKIELKRIRLMPLIENESTVPAEYATIEIKVDSAVYRLTDTSRFQREENTYVSINGNYKKFIRLVYNHAIPHSMPLFKGTKFRLVSSPFTLDIENDGTYFLIYRLIAPYMEEQNGTILLELNADEVGIETLK